MNASEQVYTVGELTREIKHTLEGQFPLLWLKGELSGVLHHRSGHLYFTVKDEKAQISAVMWRTRVSSLKVKPEDGLEVLVYGRLTVYEKGGKYQFDAQAIEVAGLGVLYQKFEALKRKLEAEGLFDEARKKRIPDLPRRIGVLTSGSGAAVRDILVTLTKRGFDLEVVFIPVKVQGDDAAPDIVRGIKQLISAKHPPDVIIIGRGGGSIEDLWAFNEEMVVRAIAECPVPVISGVGHETDFTLADFVADLRAPTPTGAAVRATQDRDELRNRVELQGSKLQRSILHYLVRLEARLERSAGAYGLKRLPDRIQQYSQNVDEWELRLGHAMKTMIRNSEERLSLLKEQLEALSPTKVLKRGYSIVSHEKRTITDASELLEGMNVELVLARGEAGAVITEVKPSKQ